MAAPSVGVKERRQIFKLFGSCDSCAHLFAGGVAGAVSRTIVSPLERVKILSQIQHSNHSPVEQQGIFRTLRYIARRDGFRGYFLGNGTNVLRIAPYSAVQFAVYEKMKRILQVESRGQSPGSRFLCGAVAGTVSVVVTYPLDLVRTRLSAPTEFQRTPSLLTSFPHIFRTEGIRAFYKGLFPTVVGIAPYIGLNFMMYEFLKVFFKQRRGFEIKGWRGSDLTFTTVKERLACGALAGAVAQTITYPLDVIRRKMQIQGFSEHHPVYGSTMNCLRTVYVTEGISGLYRGVGVNLLKVAPSIGVTFVTYEITKAIVGGYA